MQDPQGRAPGTRDRPARWLRQSGPIFPVMTLSYPIPIQAAQDSAASPSHSLFMHLSSTPSGHDISSPSFPGEMSLTLHGGRNVIRAGLTRLKASRMGGRGDSAGPMLRGRASRCLTPPLPYDKTVEPEFLRITHGMCAVKLRAHAGEISALAEPLSDTARAHALREDTEHHHRKR